MSSMDVLSRLVPHRQRPTLGSRSVCRRLLAAGAAGGIACIFAACSGHAAEHITLRNGFELTCDHRGSPPLSAELMTQSSLNAPLSGQLQPNRIRLYLDAAESNYLDVAPGEILQSEHLAATALSAPAAPAARGAAGANKEAVSLSSAELHQLLAGAGAEHDLDVDLLASLVHAESGSRPHAVSRAGAQGLMQLMPATATEMGVKDNFLPEANVHGGTAYLDNLLKRYHDNLALALAAYNAGPGAVDRWHGIPPYHETRAYVARIIHEFNQRYTARQASLALAQATSGHSASLPAVLK